MKAALRITVGLLLLTVSDLSGATLYVSQASLNPAPPYATWATAATNIQDAVAVASSGSIVVVTNGLYAGGIEVKKPLYLIGINGARSTIIDGGGISRCLAITNGVGVSGFTLTNGRAANGGGVWCHSTNAWLTNCVLAGNSATNGGGAHGATLYSCLIWGNSAGLGNGGGAHSSMLFNCTVAGNSAQVGGGAYSGALYNSIVYWNTAPTGPNYANNYWLLYCCTAPLPGGGDGNIAADPLYTDFAGGDLRLASTSPCLNAGNNLFAHGSADLDGNPRISGSKVDMGAYEFQTQPSGVPAITLQPFNQTVSAGSNVTFTAEAEGARPLFWQWLFNDGAIRDATNSSLTLWAVTASRAGVYSVVVSNALGYARSTAAMLTVWPDVEPSTIHYVWPGSPNPVPPYNTWATAAHMIQSAVDAASPGHEIVVTNGTYEGGLWVSKPALVRSVNGPRVTTINGGGQSQCAALADGASLSGFTLTNGAASSAYGGGVDGESIKSVVTNCVIEGNSAYCGGGAFFCTLYNCILNANSATYGGGAYGCTLYNCSVTGNSATDSGGGAQGSKLYNCTLTGNSAAHSGGGAKECQLYNSIAFYNRAASGENYDSSSSVDHCCTIPLLFSGNGNISLEPQLADARRLTAGSPCRGAGSGTYVLGSDLDGQPWGNPPSIGCDEYYAGPVTGPLSVGVAPAFTNVAVGFPVSLTASIVGNASLNEWVFGDGTIVTNQLQASHRWYLPGDYTVRFRAFNDGYPAGVGTEVTIHVAERAVHYVNAGSAGPVAPYLDWQTAATNIQDAVDAAVPGDEIVVTNGVYAAGGARVESYLTTNRVAVCKPLTVRSLNGPSVTVIQGYVPPWGAGSSGAIRCVYLTGGAILSGFTLTNGATASAWGLPYADQMGGGVFGASASATVTNCVLTGNSSGGVYGATLRNCLVVGNSAYYSGGGASYSALYDCILTNNSAGGGGGMGGGASDCTLSNCVLTANWATNGGGAINCTLYGCTLSGNSGFAAAADSRLYSCTLTDNLFSGAGNSTLYNCTLTGNPRGGAQHSTLYNCIVYYNPITGGANYSDDCALNYCCTTPLPTNGVGNITNEPALAGPWRVSSSSPCRGAGSAADAAGSDRDGEPWLNPPSMGCDEFYSAPLTGEVTLAITAAWNNVATGFPVILDGQVWGKASTTRWEFGDGTVESNRLHTSHQWFAAGDYDVVLRAYNRDSPEGVTAKCIIRVVERPVHHVDLTSAQPIAPYAGWGTAATSIQDAVDVAIPGALVLVSNGVYRTGGRPEAGGPTNRVTVERPVTIQSVNGPEATVIRGYRVPDLVNGTGAVRCVYLCNGAVLSGFTLTQGATMKLANGIWGDGGGIWCQSISAVITNCVLTTNSCYGYGGAVYSGTLRYCTLSNNTAEAVGGGAGDARLVHCTLIGNSAGQGGGAYMSELEDCTLSGNSALYVGGGANFGTLNRCTLTGNFARNGGGGVYGATLNNCLLTSNTVSGYGGGGASSSLLNNCTVIGNTNPPSSFGYGGGAYNCRLNNSILYYNSAPDVSESTLNYCCTPLAPTSGVGNITAPPLFVDYPGGDLRLQPASPCVNAGNNAFALGTADLDGLPRVAGSSVDMGAYELQQTTPLDFYAWLQQYGQPTDGSADAADPDTDGMNNWQEWVCGTNPTNALSALRLLSASATTTNVTVSWQSVGGVSYFLDRSTNLAGRHTFDSTNRVVVATNIIGQAGATSYTDTNAPGPGPFFYGVGVESSPR